MLKKIKFQIDGIHCKSCKSLIETELDILEGVKEVDVNHQSGECKIEFEDSSISKDNIFQAIEKLNYTPKDGREINKKNKKSFKFSRKIFFFGFLVVIFIVGYYLINKLGLLEVMSKLNEENIGYWLIFLIGLLASFHCIGMCGGLVITYTTGYHKKNQDKKTNNSLPHLEYNLGRLISYTIIGGILGGFGSFFAISPTFTGAITLLAAFFMILMGLSLSTNNKWLEKVKVRTPDFIARFIYNQKYSKKPKGPFVIGLLNGFMPCGPLQAMQLYALASGSVVSGASSMAVYALGTIPLMFGLGNLISAISGQRIKQIMKLSGVIVMLLGIFMLNRGLINFGYGFNGFVSADQVSNTEFLVKGEVEKYQTVNMDLTYRGYSPNVLFVEKDIPVRWVINVKQMSGCTNEIIMPEYNIDKKLSRGENIIEFTPNKLGDLKFSCWMRMVWGKFVVTEKDKKPSVNDIKNEKIDIPQGSGTCDVGAGSCGGTCGAPTCGCSVIK